MVVSSRLRETTALGAGVQQGEAAGAVGRFHHAGLETALPHRRRLLVAGHAKNADRRAEQFGRRLCRTRPHSPRPAATGSPARRTGAAGRRPIAPRPMSNNIVRAGIGGVGRMHFAAGEAPQQKAIHGAEGKPARAPPLRARRAHARAARLFCWRKNKDRAADRFWRQSRAHSRRGAIRAQKSAVRRSCQTMAL